MRRAVGVEFAASRHTLAEELLAREPATVSSRVVLVQGDCADAALWVEGGPIAGATVAYAGSLMFSDELMNALARRIEGSLEHAPLLRVVASLKRWAVDAAPRGFRETPPPELCESSWTAPPSLGAEGESEPGTPVYVYERV